VGSRPESRIRGCFGCRGRGAFGAVGSRQGKNRLADRPGRRRCAACKVGRPNDPSSCHFTTVKTHFLAWIHNMSIEDNASEESYAAAPPLHSLDLELQFGQPEAYDRELLPSIHEPLLVFNSAQEVLLTPILSYLKSAGYPLEHCLVYYFSQLAGAFVFCGNDPIPTSIAVPLYEMQETKVGTMHLTLRCREAIRNGFGTMVTVGNPGSISVKYCEEPSHPHKASRMTKERKIGYIIDKVTRWRQLYSGVANAQGEIVKYSLEEAAGQVGISKKSLDDYLLQLRFGRKFGFNFQEHREEKVGVLRAYVKKHKAIQQILAQMRRGDPVSQEVKDLLAQPGTPSCKHMCCCTSSLVAKLEEMIRFSG